MKIIGEYRYYSRQEHLEYCKKNGIPSVSESLEMYRNRRTESGYPVFTPDYNSHF